MFELNLRTFFDSIYYKYISLVTDLPECGLQGPKYVGGISQINNSLFMVT
jgi:hypothetical protein